MWKTSRQFRVVVAVTSALMLAASVASAQAIGGTVTDTSGAVLPGVTVEARSPALIEQVRTVITDGAGQFLIISLRPGTYSVTYSLPGFSTVVREGIELTTGFTANVDIELAVGSIEETVTVTGASPVVDVQNVIQQEVMTREIIDTVPTGKNFQNYGILIPGMTGANAPGSSILQDVAGQSGQNYMTLSMHGSLGSDQAVHIDGMSAETLIREDTTNLPVSDGNFEEISFAYSSNSAEVSTGGVRVNLIPAEGGNAFSGGLFYTFGTPGLQSDNVDDDLIAAGLSDPNRLKTLWRVNPTVGGPIMRDRLWFFVSHSRYVTDQFVAGTFQAVDPAANVYVPNLADQAVDDQLARDTAIRLTFQGSPRNKFAIYVENGLTFRNHNFISFNTKPSAASKSNLGENIYQATWTAPLTSRLLVEFGASKAQNRWKRGTSVEGTRNLPRITELSVNSRHRNNSGLTDENWGGPNWSYRGSVSYVTGSHALKVGFTAAHGFSERATRSASDSMALTTLNGVPLRVTYYGYPVVGRNTMNPDLGIYVQDQWTIDQLTVNAGIRFDYFRNSYPDYNIAPTQWVPVSRTGPGATVVTWKDLQPRLSVAYDLFDDGRTAIKGSASRFGQKFGVDFAARVNPVLSNNTTRRNWNDLNGDFFPQGDPANPEANGELTFTSNTSFGLPVVTRFFDPEWAFGWNKKPSNWEFSLGVQQEVASGVSVDASYFHRAYINFATIDNRLQGPGDFDSFSVTAPVDSRLPGGGGYMINGFLDPTPAVAGLTDRIDTGVNQFGGRSRTWDGFDVGVNTRLEALLLQGGLSVGKTSNDSCALFDELPESLGNTPRDFCKSSTPFLTQYKLLGSYTFPYEIQVALTWQNFNGVERVANVQYGNADIAPSLGRPLANRSRVSINVLEPGAQYAERLNQLDLRLTKIVTLPRAARLRAMFDLYNVLNGNSILGENTAFGAAWLRPRAVLPGRLIKFAFQVDF